MRLTPSSPTSRAMALLTAAVLVLASCGGGDDARSVLSGNDSSEPSETESPSAEPPTTDSPTTDASVSTAAPTTTAPPSTEAPTTDVAPATAPSGPSTGAYCGASSQFYVEAMALREIAEGDNEGARRLFERMQVSLTATLINAPDEAAAATPRRMEAVFEVLLPAFDSLAYDVDELDTLPNADDVAESFTAFVEIVDELEAFLPEGCGADLDELQRRADELAVDVGSSGDLPDPAPGVDGATGIRSISDDGGSITVDVPAAWSDVRGEPDGDLDQLLAGPDVDAFLAGYSEPGVAIVSGGAPAGDADAVAQTKLADFSRSAEADGCTDVVTLPYDDGLYTGDHVIYTCPETSSTTQIAAGTNAVGDVFWLLAVVTEDGDDESWILITESFLVD